MTERGRRNGAARRAQPPAGAGRRATPEPEEALTAAVSRLRAELDGLRRAMRNRAVIEQAKGVLVERLGLSPDAAFDQLIRLSQQANIKLVEVAAALVGTRAPDPAVPDVPAVVDDELRALVATAQEAAARPRPAPRRPDIEQLHSRHQLIAARIGAADSGDEIASAIAESQTGWPAPTIVVLTALEADGALRLAGSYGLDAEARSQWNRIPPFTELPLVTAVRDRAPVWLGSPEEVGKAWPAVRDMPYPTAALVAFPLVHADRLVGSLGLTWDEPVDLADDVRRYLHALAEPCARRLSELQGTIPEVGSPEWLPPLAEAALNPAAVLTPVYDGDRLVDFRFGYANKPARAFAEGERIDLATATLLTVFPGVASELLLPALTEVLGTGSPAVLNGVYAAASQEGTRRSYTLDMQATRMWDQLLLVWRVSTEADLLHEQLLEAERIAHIGSYWWDLRTDDTRWSPELYRIFRRKPSAGPLTIDDLDRYVHPDDWLAVQEAIRGTLVDGREMLLEFRFSPAGSPPHDRRLRLSAEALRDADGAVRAVRGTAQDVTTERAVEARLRRAEEAVAAQRTRLEAERQRLQDERRAAETLQRTLLPTAPELAKTDGLTVRGLCRPAVASDVAGDWYDVFGVAEQATVLVVGDVTGTGLAAATAAARLRSAVRAYAALGMGPAGLLGALNAMQCQLDPDHLATLVVARFEPGDRSLRWAAAGQAAPIRYAAGGKATVLSGPLGLPVGVAPEVEYDEARVIMQPSDRVLLYTDGLVVRRDSTLAAGLDALYRAARETDLDDAEALVRYVVGRLGSEPEDDLCVVAAEVTG